MAGVSLYCVLLRGNRVGVQFVFRAIAGKWCSSLVMIMMYYRSQQQKMTAVIRRWKER